MDQLIRVAEQMRGEVHGLLRKSMDMELVQGAVLEIDRYWYEWAVFTQLGHYDGLWPQPEAQELFAWLSLRRDLPKWDFDKRPEDWEYHCSVTGYGEGSSPLIVRVILKAQSPGLTKLRIGDLPGSHRNHTVLYEARPPLVAANALHRFAAALLQSAKEEPRSLSVGRSEPRTSGTLGGFLHNPLTGTKYLVSCAHVFGPPEAYVYTPGPHEHRDSAPIGEVRFSEIPPLKRSEEDCNLFAAPNAGRLDVSVAEWIPNASEAASRMVPVSAASVLRAAAKISPYQRVAFVGKESGRVEAQVGATTLWHEIEYPEFGEGPAGTRCFGSLFELTDFYGDRRHIGVQGDSGAWIYDDQGGLRCWSGMLIAVQGRRSYCCYAQWIMEALAKHPAFAGGLAMRW